MHCDDGVCVPGKDPGSDCEEGSDCDRGQGTCRSGVCQPKTYHGITPGTAECATNAPCAAGEIYPNGGCLIACNPSVERILLARLHKLLLRCRARRWSCLPPRLELRR